MILSLTRVPANDAVTKTFWYIGVSHLAYLPVMQRIPRRECGN